MTSKLGACCERHGLGRLCASAEAQLSRNVLQRVVCNSTVVRTSRQCDACVDNTPLTFHVSGLDLASKIWGELRTGSWSGSSLRSLHNSSSQDVVTILDVGGNLGIFAAIGYRQLRKRGVRCVRILTIEPLPESFLFLKWNLEQNGVLESPPNDALVAAAAAGDGRPRWCGVRALNVALTSGARVAHMVVGTRSMTAHEASTRSGRRADGSFQLEWDAVGGAGDPALKAKAAAGGTRGAPTTSSDGYRHYEVPGMTIKELLRSNNITRVDLLKLDCEGCEYELLRELRASPMLASALQRRVKRVSGELHMCSKMYSLRDRERCQEARAYFKGLWPEVPALLMT